MEYPPMEILVFQKDFLKSSNGLFETKNLSRKSGFSDWPPIRPYGYKTKEPYEQAMECPEFKNEFRAEWQRTLGSAKGLLGSTLPVGKCPPALRGCVALVHWLSLASRQERDAHNGAAKKCVNESE